MAKKKAVKKAPAASGEKPMKKAAAVREIMATGVKDIKAIQQQAKEKYGLEIAYQNVYTLLKAGSKTGGKKKVATKANPKSNGNVSQLGALAAGVQFIKAAGGIEQAKSVLKAIEDIRSF